MATTLQLVSWWHPQLLAIIVLRLVNRFSAGNAVEHLLVGLQTIRDWLSETISNLLVERVEFCKNEFLRDKVLPASFVAMKTYSSCRDWALRFSTEQQNLQSKENRFY